MAEFAVFLAVTAVMGFTIFLSLPIVYSPRAQGRWAVALNAGAIGILLFLLADIFGDVAPTIYPNGYVAATTPAVAFALAFAAAFVGLWAFDHRLGRSPATGPPRGAFGTATIVALGIGLQNLTEGLVFGGNWTAGSLGLVSVVFLGFGLQNLSEGFPIAAPFLGKDVAKPLPDIALLYFIGGVPTILGGAIGYFWSSPLLLVVFDALAIGAIAYVILPMLRAAFRPLGTRELSLRRDRLVYLGVCVGFLVGFAVNAL